MNTLRLTNFTDNNLKETSYLTEVALQGATSITVANSEGYAVGEQLLIGYINSEQSEIRAITAIPDSRHITVAQLTLNHIKNEPINSLFGNQLKLYSAPVAGSSIPIDAAFIPVAQPVPINTGQIYTDVTDIFTSGAAWYKYVYFNSIDQSETSLSGATARLVGGTTTNYCSLSEIRGEAGFKNATYIGDDVIDQKRQAAQAQVNSALSGLYTMPLSSPVDPHIKQITLQIAAGLLMNAEYGLYGRGTDQGNAKLAWAEAELEKFKSKELVILNPDGTDSSLPGAGSGGASGWPNNTTEQLGPDNGGDNGPAFTRGRRY